MSETPGAAAVTRLRLEQGSFQPRLSWSIETTDTAWKQVGYQVSYQPEGGETQQVEVTSAEQVLVPWPFEPLASRARGTVQVSAIGADGATDPSEAVGIEVGLQADDWQARFISPVGSADRLGPAPVIFTSSELPADIASARLYVTALGAYVFSINGARVGEDVLNPGWTSYSNRLRFHTYDVTELLRTGDNDLQAIVGNGWYRGRLAWGNRRNHYGDRVALLAQLEVTDAAGNTTIIGTDETWQSCDSGILMDDIYDGQQTDLRISNDPAGKETRAVEVIERDLSTLVAPQSPPVRVTEILPALKVWTSPAGKTLIDFGQNLVGWLRVKARGGNAGDEVVLRHAEVLEHDELGVRPLRTAQATDTFILTGAAEELLEPTFTFHGFRYAEVSGLSSLEADQLEAVVLHSDLVRTGWFESSSADLNQLHQNVVWGMRGNFLDVPTDCPQRDERLGWTGDIQVFSPTASFLYDSDGFLSGWLRDLAADQFEDGSVPFVIPDVLRNPAPAGAAWGDAAAVVPWVLYQRYADADVLKTQYPSMKGWVDKISSLAQPNGLWSGGFQFGDWLDPTAPPDAPADAQADPDVVATAHLIYSARIVADTAELLGNEAEAAHYREISERSLAAFRSEYVTASGRVLSDCPTVYSLAICWSLLDEEQQTKAGQRLASLVRSAAFRVSTGFVGTPLILEALSLVGEEQLAYRLLLEKGCPSWLYPITMGATTIWERWDSMLPDGTINPGQMTSFNHYAFGAVADWMHRRIAGLDPIEPGYRRVRIAPTPGGGLTSASAKYDSGYGEIAVSWTRADGSFQLDLRVPVGVTAEVHLPGSAEVIEVGHGEHTWTVADPDSDAPLETLADLLDNSEVWQQVTQIVIKHGEAEDDAAIAKRLAPYHHEPADKFLERSRRNLGFSSPPSYAEEIEAIIRTSQKVSVS